MIWVAVGGRGTLTGAVLGAFVVNYAKTYFTSGVLAPYWLFMLGGLFIGITCCCRAASSAPTIIGAPTAPRRTTPATRRALPAAAPHAAE